MAEFLNEGDTVFNEAICRSLVLNSSYEPIKVIGWQKALILWFQDKVEVLEFHSTFVRSARDSFRLPSVMRLKRYIRPRNDSRVKFSRENVYLRDHYTCQYCNVKFSARELTLDHVIPASKMGLKTWTNVVTACRPCNHRKSNRTPLAANMPLRSPPRVPDWLPAHHLEINKESVPETWLGYLFFEGPTAKIRTPS